MPALSNIIRIVLIALLVITPWFFGGVLATAQWALMFVAAVLLAMDVASRFSGEDRPSMIPTAWLPVLAGILLGLVQLIPWSPQLAAYVAPQTLAWRTELTDDRPDPEAASATASEKIRRTVYAVATREYLALLTLAMAVFALSSLHLVDRQSLYWLLWSVGLCGAALSFFGLVQRLSWNGKFYWIFESVNGGLRSFGPFVNRNNGGGFLNLCLAAALGLLIWLHTQPEAEYDGSSSSSRRRRRSRSSQRGRSSQTSATSDHGEGATGDAVTNRSTAEAADTENPSFGDVGELREVREPQSRSSESRRRSSSRGAHTGYARASYPASYGTTRTGAADRVSSAKQALSEYFANLNAMRLAALAITSLTAGGVLCTASRGSILALFAAALVTVSALALQRGQRGLAAGLLMLLLAGGGLMSWAGQTDFVTRRFERMLEEPQYQSGRWAHWQDAINVVPEFQVWGTGLGTHRLVYERYQHRFLSNHIYTHAENQYLQSLIEGGVVALGLLLSAIFLTMMAVVRLYRTGGPVNLAVAVTGTFALASQVVGGVFDFGLYIPANAMLMAAMCGVVVGRAALLTVWPSDALDVGRSKSRQRSSSRRRTPAESDKALPPDSFTVSGSTRSRRERRSRQSRRSKNEPGGSRLLALPVPSTLTTFISGFLLLGCLFGSLEMNKASRLEAALRHAPLDRLTDETDPQVIAVAAAPLVAALPQRWDDANGHRHLARLQMMQYRAETYQRLLAEAATAKDGELAADSEAAIATEANDDRDDELWSRASVVHLHQAIRDLERNGRTREVNALRNGQLVHETLLPATGHLRLARQFSPTIPEVHYELAALSALDPALNSDDEVMYLNRLHTLSPGNATFWFLAGQLDLDSDRKDRACFAWNRSLQLAPMHLNEIVSAAQGQLTIGELLTSVLPNRSDMLLYVARKFFAGDGRERIQKVFLKRAEEALDETHIPPAELAYTAAVILRMQGRGAEAVPHYREAMMLDRTKLPWQYEFATLLLELKEYDAALEISKSLMNARPDVRTYERLHRQILGEQLRNQRTMN